MRLILIGLLFVLMANALVAQESAPQKSDLSVLYLAQEDNDERQESFQVFLEKHFAKVTALKRNQFDRSQLGDADVVVVDWSQREDRAEDYSSPLGDLEDWSTPTVLLGSAGIIMAGPWDAMGGSG